MEGWGRLVKFIIIILYLYLLYHIIYICKKYFYFIINKIFIKDIQIQPIYSLNARKCRVNSYMANLMTLSFKEAVGEVMPPIALLEGQAVVTYL